MSLLDKAGDFPIDLLLMRPVRKLRSAISFVLILWCAGTGCLLVSYARFAATPTEGFGGSGRTNWQDASASMATQSCHHSQQASSTPHRGRTRSANSHRDCSHDFGQTTLTETTLPSGAMNCCPLTSGTFVITSRTQSNDSNSSAPVADSPVLPALASSRPASLEVPLRLPNEEQTYLRCCAFLI